MKRFRHKIRESALSAIVITLVLVTSAYFFVERVTGDRAQAPITSSATQESDVRGEAGNTLNVTEMERAVFEYRRAHRSARLDVTSVVSGFIRAGDDTNLVEESLTRSGYKIFHDQDRGRDIPDSLAAERSFCSGLSRMTGFCDSLRIIFHNSSGHIANVTAFVFFNAL